MPFSSRFRPSAARPAGGVSKARRRALRSLVMPLGLAIAGALPLRAHAQGAIEQLRRFVADTRSARGEFTQRTLKGAGQSAQTASGRFAFSRPGRFRWEVLKPFEQLMVADGERVHFYDRDLAQVTVRKLANSLGASPAAILFGSNDLEKDFTLTDAGPFDGMDWLDAKPRSGDAGFDHIRIGFRDGLPGAMEVRDAFGRTTVFAFTGIERNAAVAPETFRFVPPKGADVIQE
ncbi:outer membrane lipoprotein chaperone LolA [Quisquiliibacterium transsilvanicum]|jgi:outer membrane lipoprotein carrier protein|uniref:Outer-membrane lipoprotein carrier protein n=1 Tax=Quisquiliibacterium transsilvanicum TaxID=1549638 RepID=A0A7W8HG93_9BURK|nr:outer membrane lipoprotein chaperone LolA [Quisquiliibacterium transsilvanicum]MBB5270645.1 outer membrane lipoprotein carrier protein [Quisquiliibacterium transsilvanicum]